MARETVNTDRRTEHVLKVPSAYGEMSCGMRRDANRPPCRKTDADKDKAVRWWYIRTSENRYDYV